LRIIKYVQKFWNKNVQLLSSIKSGEGKRFNRKGKDFLKKQKPSRKAELPFSRALKAVEGTTSFGEGRKK